MSKRYIWKTLSLTSYDDLHRLSATWRSSKKAFGKKSYTFDIQMGWGNIETDLPIRALRDLFRFAGVKFPRDFVTDTMRIEERYRDEPDTKS